MALHSRSPFPIHKQKDNPYLPVLHSSKRKNKPKLKNIIGALGKYPFVFTFH